MHFMFGIVVAAVFACLLLVSFCFVLFHGVLDSLKELENQQA